MRVRESAAHGVYVPEAVHRLIEWEEVTLTVTLNLTLTLTLT